MKYSEEIYLQENMGVDGETTWADSRITDEDIKYIRADKIKDVEQLQEELKEAYKIILINPKYVYTCPEYGDKTTQCKYCDEELFRHHRDCIVLKAEKYLYN